MTPYAMTQDPGDEHEGRRAAAPSRAARSVFRWLLAGVAALLVLLIGTAVLVALAIHLGVDQRALQGWRDAAGAVRRWGLLGQCLVVAAAGIGWPAIVRYGQRRGLVQESEYDWLLALRWKVIAFGAAYLLLIPIGPATLWHLFV